jgi:hypothetical protein
VDWLWPAAEEKQGGGARWYYRIYRGGSSENPVDEGQYRNEENLGD